MKDTRNCREETEHRSEAIFIAPSCRGNQHSSGKETADAHTTPQPSTHIRLLSSTCCSTSPCHFLIVTNPTVQTANITINISLIKNTVNKFLLIYFTNKQKRKRDLKSTDNTKLSPLLQPTKASLLQISHIPSKKCWVFVPP